MELKVSKANYLEMTKSEIRDKEMSPEHYF